MKTDFDIRISILVLVSSVGLGLGPATATAHAQTNLIANGSFEAGPAGERQFTDWDWLGPAGSFSNYGVAESGVSPDLAEQGNYYAYFRGHPTDNSQDCLGITVHVKPGALYNITYYLATDGSTLGTGAAMWVVIGTSFGINLSQDIMLTAFFPNSSNAIPYQKFSTNYLGTTALPTILSFHGINATNGLAVTNGILLDNVSMTLTFPPLNLDVSSGSLVFQWPFTNSPYRLQVNSSLASTNWVTVTNTPANVGTNNQIAVPMSASPQFYRLILP